MGGITLPSRAYCLLVITLLVCAGISNAEPLFKGSESRPSDAIILFDGKDLSEWALVGSDKPPEWKVQDGYVEVTNGNIRTKRQLTDCQLHVEFWLPLMPDASGQGRANSGIFLQGSYEIQVLDSYGLKSQLGDCGAIYGIAVPLVNACRPPEQWQSYDIFFHAPRFKDGKQTGNARMSVLQNGVWIHDNVEIPGETTASAGGDLASPGPIMLQDHGNPIRYRNIWIRDLAADKH